MRKRRGYRKQVVLAVLLMLFAGCASVVKVDKQSRDLDSKTGRFDEGTAIVVALHGIPGPGAGRFLSELMMLEGQIELGYGKDNPKIVERFNELDEKMKSIPLAEKDPYNISAIKFDELLEQETGAKVYVGFNEMCAPSLVGVLEEAANEKPKKIMVVTDLIAANNDHAESEILETIIDTKNKYPDIEFVYAWPYPLEKLVRLFYDQLLDFADETELAGEETKVVLVMHGVPSTDMPLEKLMEMMMMRALIGRQRNREEREKMRQRVHELEDKILNWPRPEDDAYYAGTIKTRELLSQMIGAKVLLGYNEFCAPSLEQVLEQAVDEKTKKVIVITSLIAPGNPHGEYDIDGAVRSANRKYPDVEFVYAWPFSYDRIVQFFLDQLLLFKDKPGFWGK